MSIRKVRNANPGEWRSILTMIGVATLAALWMALSVPVGAQVDVGACGSFQSQEDAQAALDADPNLVPTLDGDGNGIACEGFNQSDLPIVLICNEATGTLVEASEEAADLGQTDFPYHLATAGEMTAGACAATASNPDDADSGDAGEGASDAISLGIWKFNCPNAAAAEAEYADCEPGGNATFQVATGDGDVLGSCTTEVGVVRETEVGFCYVGDVPFEAQLVITEDVSTGFVPLENPKTMTIQRPAPDAADFTPTVIFVNLPAEDLETPEPTPGTAPVTPEAERESDTVTALPETGTGTTAERSQPGPLLVVLLALTMIAFGLRSRMCRSMM